jgi:hypothetical protein
MIKSGKVASLRTIKKTHKKQQKPSRKDKIKNKIYAYDKVKLDLQRV